MQPQPAVYFRLLFFPSVILLAISAILLPGCGGASSGGTAPAESGGPTPASSQNTPAVHPSANPDNPEPPGQPVKLIFIHHSVGEDWLDDTKGGLGKALMADNYFVSDTNYGWGPPDADAGSETIGDHTDIGYWYDWFNGPNSSTYLAALYSESGEHSGSPYSRLANDPGGENQVIMFKSCFPNSQLTGAPSDPPATGPNPLRGQASGSESQSVGNAKGIYRDLLGYFASRQDRLFIVVTAPPLKPAETDATAAANARAFNTWLVNDWLAGYPYRNVAVFDLYDVLTSSGGSPEVNDSGSVAGNHHRYSAGSGTIEYVTSQGSDFSAYGSQDSHPTAAGLQKASDEFVQLLNISYHRWKGGG